jgi:hypothetical protein
MSTHSMRCGAKRKYVKPVNVMANHLLMKLGRSGNLGQFLS